MAGYKKGCITRIKMKGFMTYDEIEFEPKRGLNLIIGLNGSGKSSIMSAICLGLGGRPIFTGRSVNLSEFVNFNHTKAEIEIDLEAANNKQVSIRRVIQGTHTSNDKSSWYLNNSIVNQNTILNVVKEFNIDMGNLCQFLPQEKVAEFSKMDKKQRLENMIQAIGEPNLVILFEELKELRKKFCFLENELEHLENKKNSEVQLYERLKPEIEKQEARQRLLDQLTIKKIQKMALQYNMIQCSIKDVKREKKQLAAELTRSIAELEELTREKGNHEENSNKNQKEINNLKNRILKLVNQLTKCADHLHALHGEADQAKIYFQTRCREKEEQKAKLNDLMGQIRGLKELQEEKSGTLKDLKASRAQHVKEFDEYRRQLSILDPKREQANVIKNALDYQLKKCMEVIQSISNEENKKFEFLRQRFPDTYKAVRWLQENKGSFKANIALPALVSIKVSNEDCFKYVENAIPLRDLLMFVCEDEDDIARFLNIMKKQQKLSVNVSMVPKENLSEFTSPPITTIMKTLGMKCYLKDLFTAPDPVMRALCKLHRVHLIPVCNQNAEKNIERLLSFNSVLFTSRERIAGKKSLYGSKNFSVKRDVISVKNILPSVKDNSQALAAQKEQFQKIQCSLTEKQNECSSFERERQEIERKQEVIREKMNQSQMELKQINEISIKLVRLTDIYRLKEQEIIDEDQERVTVTVTICSKNAEKMKVLSEMQKLIKELVSQKKEKAKTILLLRLLNNKLNSLKLELESKLEAREDFEKRYAEKAAEYEGIKSRGQTLFKKIEMESKKDNNFLKNITNESISLENIEQTIANLEAQLELNNEDIHTVLIEYNERERNIKDVEAQIKDMKTKIKSLEKDIQVKKRRWLVPLESHIDNINNKFSEYYKLLHCAGEISLDTTEDTDDFPNYGLQIKLKYRVDEEFQELSQSHHSGGECSVAAIIFILSLQELTEVPFRCIDEINQGMDAVNERKIYQLVADAAKNGSCSQYFLLTPKLLMDLSYHKDVAVHIIYNSPFLGTKLNVKKHLAIVRKS